MRQTDLAGGAPPATAYRQLGGSTVSVQAAAARGGEGHFQDPSSNCSTVKSLAKCMPDICHLCYQLRCRCKIVTYNV